MMIEHIKEMLKEKFGEELEFKVSGPRNQTEEFKGRILKLYNSVFTVRDSNNVIRSFTYSDILIKNLKIYNFW